MYFAIDVARFSEESGGIPIGAALVNANGRLISAGHNCEIQKNSAIPHAILDCLLNVDPAISLAECCIFTTHSPCIMCVGAIILFGIGRVVIGSTVVQPSAIDILKNNGINVEIVKSLECDNMLANFFEKNPNSWKRNCARH
jgi:creatinine deaminase